MGVGKERDEEEAFEKEKEVVELSGSCAAGLREKRVRKRWDDTKMSALTTVKVDSKNNVPSPEHDGQFHILRFWEIVREIFPVIPDSSTLPRHCCSTSVRLIAGGTYTYLQMVEVLNLVVFYISYSESRVPCSRFLIMKLYLTAH